MKKSKKVFILLMIICLNLFFTVTVNASTETGNIYNSQNSNESFIVEAYIIDENGIKLELDTMVEITELPMLGKNSYLKNNDMSILRTIKIKTSSDTYRENGIIADGSISMTWDDVSGTENKITNLAGYWSVAEGTFDHGDIYWGSDYTAPLFAPHSMQVSQEFNEDIDYTSEDSGAGKLTAHSVGVIKSPTDNKIYTFVIKVSPTIFD